MKDMGKRVYSNDILKFNAITAKALIENNKCLVKEDTINFVFKNNDSSYLNIISENFEAVVRRGVPSWLELDKDNFKATLKALPNREEITMPIQERLIVELYSK